MSKRDFSPVFVVVKLLAGFAMLMLAVSLLKSLHMHTPTYSLTLSGLLEYLSNAPNITPTFSLNSFTIYSSWGVFNGLRDFINIFANLSAFAVWFSLLIFNAIRYVGYFFAFLWVV